MLKTIPRWLLLPLLAASGHFLCAQLQIDSLRSADELVEVLQMGGALTVSNARYSGHPLACRSFSNPNVPIGMDGGVMIGTGDVTKIAAPSELFGRGGILKTPGDSLLSRKAGFKTLDGAVLEFDFVPTADSIFLKFLWASDEYPDVGWNYPDVCAIHLSGPGIKGRLNLATVPGHAKSISTNTVNAEQSAHLYIDNYPEVAPGRPGYVVKSPLAQVLADNFSLDGLTRVIVTGAAVKPGMTYHLRIAIADNGNDWYDSALLLMRGSFVSLDSLPRTPPQGALPVALRMPGYAGPPRDSIPANSKGPKVVYSQRILFDEDARTLNADQFTQVDAAATYLQADTSLHIYLVGHADSQGSTQYNLQLSQDRARAIRDRLMGQGVPASHIHFNAKGETDPTASNSNAEGRAANRRVTVYVAARR